MLTDPNFVPWPSQVAEAYRAAGLWRGQTLFEMLEERACCHPDRIAAVDRGRRVSYAELLRNARALAAGLLTHGVDLGAAVIVQLPNSVAFLEVLFGLFSLGARPVMAQPAHRSFELTQFAQRTSAVAHVVCGLTASVDYRALSREVRARCPTLHRTFVRGGALDDAEVSLDDLVRVSAAAPPKAGPAASDVALFQLSGGSTDVPKLIARTHDDYLYSVRQSVEVCGFDADTVYLAALPVAHNFPLSSPGVLGALCAGGRVVLAEHPVPDVTLPLIEAEGVTVTALVPALVPNWLSAAARRRSKLASLSTLQVGGARLHEDVARRVEPGLGARLQQVFGMAEGLVCYTRLDDPEEIRLHTQGRPMSAHDEIRVVDEEDRDLAVGETGHLLTRGPYTIRGYFGAPEHNLRAFTADGFYRTGDLVRQMPNGSLMVAGRAKDQINRGGEKISAPEVEAHLLTHPAVEAAALVGMPDPYLGERSCAFVVLDPGVEPKALIAHLHARGLAHYKIPDRFVPIASLPKTPVGKVDKRRLLTLLPLNPRPSTSPEKRP